jgi:hypothetical protein
MKRYDPLKAPDPQEWLSLDEGERIQLVEAYHRRARIELPDVTVHAVAHAIIENQLALGEEVPVRTFRRVIKEGLDRHEAIHALAMVMMEFIYDLQHDDPRTQAAEGEDISAPYYKALETLTAEGWRHSADEDE